MIIVITVWEKDQKTSREHLVCSHGVNEATGKVVILPQDHHMDVGAVFVKEFGEWVIYDSHSQG